MKQLLAIGLVFVAVSAHPAGAEGWRLIPMAEAPTGALQGPDYAIRCAALAAYDAKNGEAERIDDVAQFKKRAIALVNGIGDTLTGAALEDAADSEIARLAQAYEDTVADPEFDNGVVSKDRELCDLFGNSE
ncbi:hypothetical protein [Litoreibacter roseus]|uniref:HdeA/HdeB family protein n=1 Tax=Litoreibacter roseus TaxID=2601869 RepID=A0A6N6JBE0_9RHOB|nr:hypothetical protein [Litoreibacter roseus]GFE63571.1 hypothetical protein KIN_06450 [Litoreibacter roseus]